jgi:hypothetical protein
LRNVAGPTADGVISIRMRVGERTDREGGQTALLRGRRTVEKTASADPRFARLLSQYGCHYEIVNDYGMGTVLLGEADRSGNLVWRT